MKISRNPTNSPYLQQTRKSISVPRHITTQDKIRALLVMNRRGAILSRHPESLLQARCQPQSVGLVNLQKEHTYKEVLLVANWAKIFNKQSQQPLLQRGISLHFKEKPALNCLPLY